MGFEIFTVIYYPQIWSVLPQTTEKKKVEWTHKGGRVKNLPFRKHFRKWLIRMSRSRLSWVNSVIIWTMSPLYFFSGRCSMFTHFLYFLTLSLFYLAHFLVSSSPFFCQRKVEIDYILISAKTFIWYQCTAFWRKYILI